MDSNRFRCIQTQWVQKIERFLPAGVNIVEGPGQAGGSHTTQNNILLPALSLIWRNIWNSPFKLVYFIIILNIQ